MTNHPSLPGVFQVLAHPRKSLSPGPPETACHLLLLPFETKPTVTIQHAILREKVLTTFPITLC